MNCMKNEKCTVVVCSCDEYVDILPPFSALWRKYWPDCPFETVLATPVWKRHAAFVLILVAITLALV